MLVEDRDAHPYSPSPTAEEELLLHYHPEAREERARVLVAAEEEMHRAVLLSKARRTAIGAEGRPTAALFKGARLLQHAQALDESDRALMGAIDARRGTTDVFAVDAKEERRIDAKKGEGLRTGSADSVSSASNESGNAVNACGAAAGSQVQAQARSPTHPSSHLGSRRPSRIAIPKSPPSSDNPAAAEPRVERLPAEVSAAEASPHTFSRQLAAVQLADVGSPKAALQAAAIRMAEDAQIGATADEIAMLCFTRGVADDMPEEPEADPDASPSDSAAGTSSAADEGAAGAAIVGSARAGAVAPLNITRFLGDVSVASPLRMQDVAFWRVRAHSPFPEGSPAGAGSICQAVGGNGKKGSGSKRLCFEAGTAGAVGGGEEGDQLSVEAFAEGAAAMCALSDVELAARAAIEAAAADCVRRAIATAAEGAGASAEDPLQLQAAAHQQQQDVLLEEEASQRRLVSLAAAEALAAELDVLHYAERCDAGRAWAGGYAVGAPACRGAQGIQQCSGGLSQREIVFAAASESLASVRRAVAGGSSAPATATTSGGIPLLPPMPSDMLSPTLATDRTKAEVGKLEADVADRDGQWAGRRPTTPTDLPLFYRLRYASQLEAVRRRELVLAELSAWLSIGEAAVRAMEAVPIALRRPVQESCGGGDDEATPLHAETQTEEAAADCKCGASTSVLRPHPPPPRRGSVDEGGGSVAGAPPVVASGRRHSNVPARLRILGHDETMDRAGIEMDERHIWERMLKLRPGAIPSLAPGLAPLASGGLK